MQATLISLILDKLMSASNKSMGLLVAIALAWHTYQLQVITDTVVSSSYKSTTELAFNILKVGYKDVDSEADVIAVTRSWIERGDNAEIAAIRTVCNEEPNRLKGIVHADSVRTVCRMAQ